MRDRDRVEAESAATRQGRQDDGATLANPLSLDELSRQGVEAIAGIQALRIAAGEGEDQAVPDTSAAASLRDRLLKLLDRAEALAAAMDFRPLYRSERHLFAIGANVSQGQLDGACYDLLASESCLTSYLTVARGDTPRRHWFQLGRPYLRAAGRIGLVSWGGTMFEYLMPRLLLRTLPDTLLAEACRTAVARHIEYGQQLGIPWGVSESAFNAQFLEGDYQYQSFGVPGLGLKRGLEQDRVVAPYATVMATMIAPREALANLRRLASEGAEGPFGFYEAIDYTPDRLPQNARSAVVRSYMAHHQGMSLVALTNALCHDLMPRRFHAEPMVRAAELLLQERIPPDSPIVEPALAGQAHDAASTIQHRFSSEPTPDLSVHGHPANSPPLEHSLSRHGDQRGFGLQPVPGPGCHALARGSDLRGLGPVLSTFGTFRPEWSGRRDTSRSADPPMNTKWSFPPTGPHSADATATSRLCSRSPCLPSSRPRFAGSP